MEKFLFVSWRFFGIDYKAVARPCAICLLIFTLISSPCFAYGSASEDKWGKGYESIVQQPDFLKACVPCFEYVGRIAGPMDIMFEQQKTIDQGMPGSRVAIEPIEKDGSRNAKSDAHESRKKLYYVYVHSIAYILLFGLILYLLLKNSDLRFLCNLYKGLFDIPPEKLNYRWDSKEHVWIPK